MSRLKISTQDLESERDNPYHLWTTGPSSPPFHHAQSQHNVNDSLPSSPSTPSEFEFGSISSLEIKDDPPVSPKILSSFASTYWGTAAVSSFDLSAPAPAPAPVMKQNFIPISHPILSSTDPPPSAPDPSPSVRQLMADEMHGEHDDDFNLDFYSAPQTPMWTPPRKSSATASEQRPLSSQDESSLNIVTSHVGQRRRRKSNSAVLDRRAHDELAPLATQKNQMLQASKSEPNSHFASSFAWEKSEEENNGVIKSKSYVKWAFKDLLRRTVPSSKAEAGFINKAMGASSSKKYLWSTKSNPNMSPLASPMHSSSMSTPRAAATTRPPSTPGRSPMHGPSSPAHSSSSPRRPPSTPGRTPPRSPLSPHAIHYQQNKAQSLELTRKTFLPYRQSLLGCLGGPSSFSPDQQVW